MNRKIIRHFTPILCGSVAALLATTITNAAPLSISDTPLFVTQSAPPLSLLVMGRDHKLYYEAYNDASDLNGDGTLDVGYKGYVLNTAFNAAQPVSPTNRRHQIDYYGYFDSFKCYTYSTTNARFEPASTTTSKTCSGQWSGDFLNYLTTSRIDAMRKVFYGGTRSTDSTTETVLERSHIPQDAHTWGKEYRSTAVDGYNISNYTPLAQPSGSNRHLFANTTLRGATPQQPLLRVLTNNSNRIWQWVSKEAPVADNSLGTPTDYVVRVQVCVALLLDPNCKVYGSSSKPTGLLHDYGENDRMMFGLLSGSYTHNTQGGVLRKAVSSFTNEVNAVTGQFTSTVGIVETLDRFMTFGFRTDFSYEPGWDGAWITSGPITDGQQNMWGNPVAEMTYEGLRYFAGLQPLSAFSYGTGTPDASLGLPQVTTWADPYTTYPRCAKPFMLVVSDINPSYDTDNLPGVAAAFGTGITGDLPGAALNVSTGGNTIWTAEFSGSRQVFIGQSGSVADGSPTAKTVTGFGDIRGLAPEEPTKNGGYYTASVSHYGYTNDVNSGAAGAQEVSTFAVALASPLPRIAIPVNGRTITLVPFAKSVGGCLGITPALSDFQPTNQIVDFYVESLTSSSGVFRINFEDVEQGADHDMDAIVEYRYTVTGSAVDIQLTSLYAAGCIIQHAGYVISGSNADGTYLEVRDIDTAATADVDFFLDTPTGQLPSGTWNDGAALPITTTRTFTAGTSSTAMFLKDPLWYAAKWGGFIDANNNDRPDNGSGSIPSEWDTNNDGTPDNYFLVTNALTLQDQLQKSFNEILRRSASFSAVATNTGSLNTNSALYKAGFNTADWSGQLDAIPIDPTTGNVAATPRWVAATILGNQIAGTGGRPARQILTYKPTSTSPDGIPFRWTTGNLTTGQEAALNIDASGAVDTLGSARLDYVRGSAAQEGTGAGDFRERLVTKLGDIVNSSPVFVGQPAARYRDPTYATFRAGTTVANRMPMIYVGGNDGMLHAFNACVSTTETGCSDASRHGAEIFAYVPNEVFPNLTKLTSQNYTHTYFVDGTPAIRDAALPTAVTTANPGGWTTVLVGGLRKGGRGYFALDVTNPATVTESNAAASVLWEFTSTTDADLGYSFSEPAIVQMNDGRWAAVFGNGYNSTGTGEASLFIVFIDAGIDGTWAAGDYIKISTGVGSPGTPNGLATPAVVDINGDFKADYIYAGDLLGNMWRFDVKSTTATSWAAPTLLFAAGQPITSRPMVGVHPQNLGGQVVYFGTGKYIETTDNTATGSQAFYGVWDRGGTTGTVVLADLLAQTVTGTTTIAGVQYRQVSTNAITWRTGTATTGTHLGWHLALPTARERQVTNSILRDGRIIFTTLIPSTDPCNMGGSGWLMQLDASNGGALGTRTIDTDGDGDVDSDDTIVSGIYEDGGLITEPTIQRGPFPTQPPCTTPPCTPPPPPPPCRNTAYLGVSSGETRTFTFSCESDRTRQSWRQLK